MVRSHSEIGIRLGTYLWCHWNKAWCLTAGTEMRAAGALVRLAHVCTLPLPLLLQQVGEVVALVHVVSVLVLLVF